MPKDLVEKETEVPVEIESPFPPKTLEENISSQVANLLNKAGTIKLTPEQEEILYAPVPKEEIELREDGLYYLPWTFYVGRLRKAFGNEWAQIPAGKPSREGNLILQPFWLFIYGKPQAWAIGQQEYIPTNKKMTYGDAIEACSSNGLMRLCKRIGIGIELWDKKFIKKLDAERRNKTDKSPQPKSKEQDGKITEEHTKKVIDKAKENNKEYDKMKIWMDKNKIAYTEKQLNFFMSLYKSHTITDEERKKVTDSKKGNLILHGISDAIDFLKPLAYNRRIAEDWILKESHRKDIKLSAEILQHFTKDEKTGYDLQREVVMVIETYGGKDSKAVDAMLKKHLGI